MNSLGLQALKIFVLGLQLLVLTNHNHLRKKISLARLLMRLGLVFIPVCYVLLKDDLLMSYHQLLIDLFCVLGRQDCLLVLFRARDGQCLGAVLVWPFLLHRLAAPLLQL